MKRQFCIKLPQRDGARHNFLAYGALEKIIAAGWLLKDRIKVSSEAEIFVFETESKTVPDFKSSWPYDEKKEDR